MNYHFFLYVHGYVPGTATKRQKINIVRQAAKRVNSAAMESSDATSFGKQGTFPTKKTGVAGNLAQKALAVLRELSGWKLSLVDQQILFIVLYLFISE